MKKLEPELLKLHEAWMQLKEVYTPELQEAVMSTKSIIQCLDTEIKEERPVVFARTLELYEEGLSKWDKAGQVAAGDVLLDRDAKVWLVAKADAEGRIKHIIGDVKYDKDDEMMGMKYEEDKLLYHWKPGKKPRKWLQDGQQYSRAIKAEGDEVMKQLVMLWGERKGKENDEDLGRFPGFFREFLRIAGIQDPEYHFNDELDLQAVINFCQTHGEGLIDYTTAVLIEPGDVLIPFHENTIWVVTRATADGKPLDVVAGGNYKPGYLGEKAGDVQMHHNIDTDDIKQYWKPNSSPRDWNH